jgi:PAS domain S-box-containing protein
VRKQSELALQRSEAKFRSYVQSAPSAIFVADRQGRFVDWNLAALSLLGCDPETLRRLHIWDLHPDADREKARELFVDMRDKGFVEMELPIVRRDGRRLWGWLRAVRLDDGSSLGFCQDITERKQTELALLDSRQKLDAALDAAQLGIFSRDLRTGKGSWDERTKTIFGVAPDEEITTERLMAMLAPEDRDKLQAMPQVYQRQGDSIQYRITLPSGETRWIQARGNILKDSNGRPERALGIVMDITEQKLAERAMQSLEEQFRHAQKMEAVGRLAGGVAARLQQSPDGHSNVCGDGA